MTARSKARKRALDLIFASEARDQTPAEALTQAIESGERPSNPYTETLVQGVSRELEHLDELIAKYSRGWTLQRMPAVDRNVLRLAIFEVLYVDEVPDAVAVSEALQLVHELSTDESPTFVNGLLGNIVRDKAVLSG